MKIAAHGVTKEKVKVTHDTQILTIQITDSFWGEYSDSYILSKRPKEVTCKVADGVVSIEIIHEDIRTITVE